MAKNQGRKVKLTEREQNGRCESVRDAKIFVNYLMTGRRQSWGIKQQKKQDEKIDFINGVGFFFRLDVFC
jgi:hypothetical protein